MKYNLRASLVASVTAVAFLFASCVNSIDEHESGTGKSTVTAGADVTNGDTLITFTGNPAYDITLLNDYWAKNGTPFPAPENAVVSTGSTTADDTNASRSAIAGSENLAPLYAVDTSKAINGFGDLVKNFSGTNLLTWAGGAALTGGINASMTVGVNMALDALGIIKSTTSYLKEISAKLDKIQNQLNTMQTMLAELSEQVNDVNMQVKYQGTLTRYYEAIQKRDSYYNNIYIDAMTCWNSINDILLDAALSSQYSNATEKAAKLVELSTKELRLNYLASFIDKEKWEKATTVDGVEIVNSDAGTAFQTYFTEHADEISTKLAAVVKNWGANQNTGASSVFKLCAYLTASNSGLAGESFNMFQTYDKYAEVCFVWEQEGYNWRQQMRDQDSALIAMTAPLAYWYYALTETLGSQSSNNKELENYVDAAIAMNKASAIVRYSTPIYQKWGSKWAGQVFNGTIKQINYVNVIKTKTWLCSYTKVKNICNISVKKFIRSDGWEYNASRLYAGYSSYVIDNRFSSKQRNVFSKAASMAMPEEWYTEMFDAYKTYSASGVKGKSVMQIFKDMGFSFENDQKISLSQYKYGSNEELFITSRRPYVRQQGNGKTGYHLLVPVVMGNNDSCVIYQLMNIGDHEAVPCTYTRVEVYSNGWNKSDDYRIIHTINDDYSSYRKFFYPVKTDTPVLAK
ncbi:MAG: hypothetical protein IJ207_05400 [Treponema sp.]|uniref:hypothetical protein n=1 Tax=Treponema sp. TaxID=166 RepID=UPI0025ED3796|nr:hypothetical protein [Treponema sp.]MBQ9281617.1 hypothetical protein [Treponema sp.]